MCEQEVMLSVYLCAAVSVAGENGLLLFPSQCLICVQQIIGASDLELSRSLAESRLPN
jgi:hypothetical protein